MNKIKIPVLYLAMMIIILSACSPASPEAMVKEAAPVNTEAAAQEMSQKMSVTPVDEGESETAQPQAEKASASTPAWFEYPLTEVTSTEVFKINDLKGKVVLVETMAIWCSNCKRQQQEVLKLHETLGERGDFVSLGLDIDINENADDLKEYVQSNNFHWKYAVATPDVLREISSLYGDQFLNPPSTPMLIVDRMGEVHTLPFGIKSASDLEELLKPYLEEGV